MEQLIIQAHKTKNWKKLTQLLHNQSQFCQLEYAIGQDDFQKLISKFQLISLKAHQKYQLNTGNLYYIVHGGYLIKKTIHQTILDNVYVKKKKTHKIRHNNGYNNEHNNGNIHDNGDHEIEIKYGYFSKLEDLLYGMNKQIGIYQPIYQTNYIFQIHQQSISEQIFQKIKTYSYEKFKFISKIELFTNLDKNILQESMGLFNFIQLSFNDILYSENQRNQKLFCLYKGQSILEFGKNKQSLTVRSPTILNDVRICQGQIAKCVSDYCIGFILDKSLLDKLLKSKKKQSNSGLNTPNITDTSSLGSLRATYLYQPQINSTHEYNQQQKHTQPLIFLHKKHKISHKKHDISPQKKQRLKQYFSNNINQQYNLNSKTQSSQNKILPLLYHIEIQGSIKPNYNEMNAKLKQRRIQRIIQPTENIIRSNSSASLLNFMTGNINDGYCQNDGVKRNIMRKIDGRIAKQLNKKWGIRSYGH